MESLTDFYKSLDFLRKNLYKPYRTIEEDKYLNAISRHKEIINSTFESFLASGAYWLLCSLKVYKETYKERKEAFFYEFIDADEIDFLSDELNEIIELRQERLYTWDESGYPEETEDEVLSQILNKKNYKNFELSAIKKVEYIRQKAREIKSDDKVIVESISNRIEPVKFLGNQTQFMELIKALIESEMIEGTQANAIKQFSTFLKIEINNPDVKLQNIKGKNTDSQTAFLNLLKDNFKKYLSK